MDTEYIEGVYRIYRRWIQNILKVDTEYIEGDTEYIEGGRIYRRWLHNIQKVDTWYIEHGYRIYRRWMQNIYKVNTEYIYKGDTGLEQSTSCLCRHIFISDSESVNSVKECKNFII